MSKPSITILARVEKLTREAARAVDQLVFAYGHLAPRDPERDILHGRIREILQQWSEEIIACGGCPHELWTVVFATDEGEYRWQYPCSQFRENSRTHNAVKSTENLKQR